MKQTGRRLLYLILFLCAAFEARAQDKYPSLFWEIKGNGLTQTSYLYGTVHSFDTNAFRHVPLIAPKIATSDVFAMEMVVDMQGGSFAEMMKYALMPGDTTIDMLLDTADYERLSKYVTDSVGLPMMLLTKVKPFFLMALFIEGNATSKGAARFLDDSLSQMAKVGGIKVVGIETMQEQIGAIDAIPLREQAKMLMQEVDSALVSSASNEMEDFIELYVAGSLDTLHSIYMEKEFSNAFQRALVIDRNRRMADRIEQYLVDKVRMFVAVGALHLPGDEGVINLLRKKGFSVTPIKLH